MRLRSRDRLRRAVVIVAVRHPLAMLAALVAVIAGCASAPPRTAPSGVSTRAGTTSTALANGLPTPTRTVLTNGVVLIVQEHRASDVVAIQLWMRVGGRDEQPDELGLTHYLEHMVFKGTERRPPGSIDRLIEGFGGTSNAFTAYDYTHYDVVLPAQHLREGIELLADIGTNASFPPPDLDAERKVVFEEMRVLDDDPEKFLPRRLAEVGFDGHPYGRPILGTRALIQALTRERLARYYHEHYVPANMTLVVVGAVSVADVRGIADQVFGRLASQPAPRADVPTAARLAHITSVDVPRNEQQAYLGLAWIGPDVAGGDSYAVDLLTYILGDSPSSRLNQAVRERDRLVYDIDANYLPRQKGGIVTITARLEPKNLDAAERSIVDTIRRVKANGVTEAERQRAIVTAESAYAFDIETAEGLAKAYGEAETTWTLDNEVQYLSRLRQITAAEIQSAARKYFGDEDYARVRLVPGGTR